MVFVLGAVAASLIALLVTPFVARRTARAAAARLEASLPVSRSEINAEKDRLRARFAAANRRLELAISRLNEKLAARMVEANRQREEIARLVSREGELAGAHANLERRVAELTTTLERAEHRLSAATAEMVLHEERLNQRSAELAHLKANISIRDLLSEEQRVELVARDTAIANLQDALNELHSTVANTAAARDQLSTNLVAQGQSVAEREQRILTLEASTTVLQAERAERIAELGRRADEIATLRAELAEARMGHDEVAALTATVASLRAENVELRRAMAVAAAEAERATEIPSQVVPISETLAARTD